MKSSFAIAACMFILPLLSGCADRMEDVGGQREEAAGKVIEAMLTGPNEELCNMDSFAVIGEGVEESDKISPQMKEIEENWQEAVGEYFAEGILEEFVIYGAARQYLGESCMTQERMSVQGIEKKQEEDDTEVYTADWIIGEEERQDKFFFRYSPEGLIEEVKVLP